MKKLIFCFLAITLGLSCTKEQELCGCSPISYSFSLLIKNQQNKDLLDPATPGAFSQAAIKIHFRQANTLKEVAVGVTPPFQITSSVTMPYYSIRSGMADLSVGNNIKEFYIDFGNGDTDTITFDSYNTSTFEPVNLKVNNKLLTKDPALPAGYPFLQPCEIEPAGAQQG